MEGRYYTTAHEWIEVRGTNATVGISDYAQHALGDVVFVDLPSVGKAFAGGAAAAVVESVKAASEVYAPVALTVTEVNSALTANPALINSAPEAEGWFFKATLTNAADVAALLTADKYADFTKGLAA